MLHDMDTGTLSHKKSDNRTVDTTVPNDLQKVSWRGRPHEIYSSEPTPL